LRRMGFAIFYHRAVYDPVTIQKNSLPLYRAADSHFV
jgi:hypothetical protein